MKRTIHLHRKHRNDIDRSLDGYCIRNSIRLSTLVAYEMTFPFGLESEVTWLPPATFYHADFGVSRVKIVFSLYFLAYILTSVWKL